MESGTHDMLMTNNGLYSNLVNAQIKQENDGEEESFEFDEQMKKRESKEKKVITEFITSNIVTLIKQNKKTNKPD